MPRVWFCHSGILLVTDCRLLKVMQSQKQQHKWSASQQQQQQQQQQQRRRRRQQQKQCCNCLFSGGVTNLAGAAWRCSWGWHCLVGNKDCRRVDLLG